MSEQKPYRHVLTNKVALYTDDAASVFPDLLEPFEGDMNDPDPVEAVQLDNEPKVKETEKTSETARRADSETKTPADKAPEMIREGA